MSERLIERIDRLAAESGLVATPEVRRFALLVRNDVVAAWPARPWVELTDAEIDDIYMGAGRYDLIRAREVEAKLKEKNT